MAVVAVPSCCCFVSDEAVLVERESEARFEDAVVVDIEMGAVVSKSNLEVVAPDLAVAAE